MTKPFHLGMFMSYSAPDWRGVCLARQDYSHKTFRDNTLAF